jgi:hypothetical protein
MAISLLYFHYWRCSCESKCGRFAVKHPPKAHALPNNWYDNRSYMQIAARVRTLTNAALLACVIVIEAVY